MENYFKTLFYSSFIAVPGFLFFFLLLKYDLIKKEDPAKKAYLSFTKKGTFIAIIAGMLGYFLM